MEKNNNNNIKSNEDFYGLFEDTIPKKITHVAFAGIAGWSPNMKVFLLVTAICTLAFSCNMTIRTFLETNSKMKQETIRGLQYELNSQKKENIYTTLLLEKSRESSYNDKDKNNELSSKVRELEKEVAYSDLLLENERESKYLLEDRLEDTSKELSKFRTGDKIIELREQNRIYQGQSESLASENKVLLSNISWMGQEEKRLRRLGNKVWYELQSVKNKLIRTESAFSELYVENIELVKVSRGRRRSVGGRTTRR